MNKERKREKEGRGDWRLEREKETNRTTVAKMRKWGVSILNQDSSFPAREDAEERKRKWK